MPDPARRYALIILDGLGDRPHPATGDRSPVEAAATPHLDDLARRGRLGQVRLIGEGVAPESDAGVLALLGYDPERDSPGRGVLEAVGLGVPMVEGDVAFRLNFATADADGTILDSRVGRSLTTDEAAQLARSITTADVAADLGVRAEVWPSVGHRGVLWLHPTSGGALGPEVSNSDPFYERIGGRGQARKVERPRCLPIRALDGAEGTRRTAEAAQRVVDRAPALLAGHPINRARAAAGRPVANALLIRHAGSLTARRLTPFSERHGITGTAVTEMPVERGIARLLGLGDAFVGPMGPDVEGALRERARATRDALRRSPFVYVHLKGPDEPGHDGRAQDKQRIIEQLDRSFFGPFLDGLDLATVRLAITADHATPCVLKAHSDDPVPWILVGAGVPPSSPGAGHAAHVKFGESAAAAGRLGTRRGADVLPALFGSADRSDR